MVDFNPVMTGTVTGAPEVTGTGWNYQSPDPALGFNVRLGVRTNVTLDGTVNPDFSQVEADVGQILSNQRFALFFPEKRPFFLEGIEKFETPNRLIYTRRIVQPVAGAKFAGKVGDWNVGLLSAVDDQSASEAGTENPIFNLLRLRRNLGGQSWAGVTYTDRIEGGNYNRMASADMRLVFARNYYVQLQAAGSFGRTGGISSRAPLWEAIVNRSGRQFAFSYRLTGIHPDFDAEGGFVPRTGDVATSICHGLSWYGGRGATVERWTTSLRFAGWWNYDGFWDFEDPTEAKFFFGNAFTLRGGWTGSVTLAYEQTQWDPDRYVNYAVERLTNGVSDTVAFTVPGRVNDAFGVLSRFETPEFGRFSASLRINRFHDVGHIEATRVNLLRITAEVNWRPTDKLRINPRYSRLVLDRRERDGTNLSTSQIPRLKIEYQLSRAIFLRFVGQYTSENQDGLRDPRTEQRILRRDSSSEPYVLTARELENDFRYDVLFSYLPTPGTVVLLGYGSSLAESEAFRFEDLRRTTDAFFLKVSYLFRR